MSYGLAANKANETLQQDDHPAHHNALAVAVNDAGTRLTAVESGDLTVFNAKGDLLAASAADTADRLAVGSNGYILVADSAQTLGMKWLAPDIINVKAPPYNAVGDGVTDDYAAVAAAIAAVPASGGIVYFPPGNYKLNTGLSWSGKPVHLLGHGLGNQPGMGARLTFAAGRTGITVQNGASGLGAHSIIEGLRLIGSDTGVTAFDGILLQANSGVIKNVRVESFGRYGVNVLSSTGAPDVSINANHCRIDDLHCSGNFSGGLHTLGTDSNAGTFTGLNLASNGGYGLDLEASLGNHVFGVHLDANTTGGIRIATGGRNWVGGVYFESENKPALTIAAGSSGQNFVHFTNCSRPDAADPIVDSSGATNTIVLEQGGLHYRRIQIGPTTAAYLMLEAGTTAATFQKGAAARFKNAAEDCNWDFQAQADKSFLVSSAQAQAFRASNDLRSDAGDVIVAAAGKGLKVAEGANARMGTAALAAGTVTVSTTAVTATSRILLTSQVDGGTPGFLRVSARTAGTSFVITSSSGTDTSTVAWMIVQPA